MARRPGSCARDRPPSACPAVWPAGRPGLDRWDTGSPGRRNCRPCRPRRNAAPERLEIRAAVMVDPAGEREAAEHRIPSLAAGLVPVPVAQLAAETLARRLILAEPACITYLPSGCCKSISQLSVSRSAVLQSTRHKAANGIFQSRPITFPASARATLRWCQIPRSASTATHTCGFFP